MYFLGRIYSCWKVLTREKNPVIYYVSPTEWSTELLLGVLPFVSTLVQRRHKRAASSHLMDEAVCWLWQCIAPHTALSRPSREAQSSTTLRHERLGDVCFFFLLLRLFINKGSISSCVREKWNVSFIEKVNKIAECSLLDKTREANITSFRIDAQHYKLLIPQPRTKSMSVAYNL